MKAGLSDALRARLRAVPNTCKLTTEAIVIAAEDVRATYAEMFAAATKTNVSVFDDGTVRITGATSTTAVISHTTDDSNITDLNDTKPLDILAWEVDPALGPVFELNSVTLRINRRRDAGQPAYDGVFAVRVGQVMTQARRSSEDLWRVVPLADSLRVYAAGMSADTASVTFSFAYTTGGYGGVPRPPLLFTGTVPAVPPGEAAPTGTVLVGTTIVVQLLAIGGSNTNYALRTDSTGSTTKSVASIGRLIHRIAAEPTAAPGWWAITDTATGAVRCSLAMTDFTATGSIQFTGGTQLDLGASVSGTVEFVVQADVPSSTSLTAYARVNGGDPWVAVTDGQTPADVGLASSQTYEMKADFSANTALVMSPVLSALGIRDRTTTDLTDIAAWDDTTESVDPLSGEVRMADATCTLSLTGDRDYRDIVTRLLSTTAFATVELRTVLTHPDLTERMVLDLWRVDDYSLSESAAVLSCVSVLERLRGSYPAATTSGALGYFLKAATSDLSGGADFNRELSDGTETAGTLAVTIAAGATETSYAFTKATVPGFNNWPPGTFTVKVSVNTANSNIHLALRVRLISADGVTVRASWPSAGTTDEQQLSSTGTYTYTIPTDGYNGGARTDRLRVDYALRNAAGSGQSVTFDTGTSATETVTPWTPTKTAAPASYSEQTLKAVYDDWIDNQVGLAGRYRGPGPSNTATVLSKNVLNQDGKRELERIAFLDGGTVIASQGRVKYVTLTGQRASVVATFPMEEYRPLEVTPGFRARVPRFTVPFLWDGAKFAQRVQVVNSTAYTAFGDSKIDNPAQVLDEETAKYIIDMAHASTIGQLLVATMGFGLMTLAIAPIWSYPELEIGDAVAVETDQFALYHPQSGQAITGPLWAIGIVTGLSGAFRNQMTVWVRGFADLYATTGTVERRQPFEGILVEASVEDDPVSTANSIVRLRPFPTDATVYYYYHATSVSAPETAPRSTLWTAYTDTLTLLRDTSADKLLSFFGTKSGVNGPVQQVRIRPDATVSITALTPSESAGAVTWTASGVAAGVRLIRWYMRRSSSSGQYPTGDSTSTGVLDESFLVAEKSVAATRGGGLSQVHTGNTYDSVVNKYATVIAVPIDYNGNPGSRLAATYTYTGGATRAPGTASWATNTAGSSTVPRTNDYTWTAGTMSASDDFKVYVKADGVEYLVAQETTDPTTTTTKTNVGFDALDGPGILYPASTAPRHVLFYFWRLYDSGGALINAGQMSPTYGEDVNGNFA